MKTFILRDLNRLTVDNGWKPIATVYAATIAEAVDYTKVAYADIGLEIREFLPRKHGASLKVFNAGVEIGFLELQEKE